MNIFKILCGLFYQGRYAAEACCNCTRVMVRRVLLDYKIQMSLVTKKEKSPLFFQFACDLFTINKHELHIADSAPQRNTKQANNVYFGLHIVPVSLTFRLI